MKAPGRRLRALRRVVPGALLLLAGLRQPPALADLAHRAYLPFLASSRPNPSWVPTIRWVGEMGGAASALAVQGEAASDLLCSGRRL